MRARTAAAAAFGLLGLGRALAQEEQYWTYYDLVNAAEAAYVNGDPQACFAAFDKAFSGVAHPFTSDRVIAGEFALASHDTTRCLGYLSGAVDDGLSRAAVQQIPILGSALTDKRFADIFARVAAVPPATDPVLRDSVYMGFYRAQLVKEKMGRDPVLRARMQELTEENIASWSRKLEKGRFPSERMIGLYTEQGFDDFLKRYGLPAFQRTVPQIPGIAFGAPIPEDIDLFNKAAFVDILHSPCSWQEHREALWAAVGNGYMHPKDYCAIEEWLVRSRGNPNYLDSCEVIRRPCYYNILFELRTDDPGLLKQVEQSRRDLHVQSYAVDQQKRVLEKKYGLVLFFGFMGWR